MSTQPLISVCIPCYNGEQFIAHTIQSILTQSYENFELVLVDDCSTDGTFEIIQGFADPRIKAVRNGRNLGLGANWNKVLSYAKGKYVKLLGGDDLLHPECLSRQVAILEANSDVVLAICNRNVISADNKILLRRGFPFAGGRVAGSKLIRSSIRWGSNMIGEPVVGLFRGEALKLTTICDASNPYCIDLALWAELLKHGEAYLDPEYLASFRISGKNASARIGQKQAGYFRRFVFKMRKDLTYKVTPFDAVLGCGLSYQWCLWRNLFMRFHGSAAEMRP